MPSMLKPAVCSCMNSTRVRAGIWTLSPWPEKDVSNYQFSKHYFAVVKYITRLSFSRTRVLSLQPVKRWPYRKPATFTRHSLLQLTNHYRHYHHDHYRHHHHKSKNMCGARLVSHLIYTNLCWLEGCFYFAFFIFGECYLIFKLTAHFSYSLIKKNKNMVGGFSVSYRLF